MHWPATPEPGDTGAPESYARDRSRIDGNVAEGVLVRDNVSGCAVRSLQVADADDLRSLGQTTSGDHRFRAERLQRDNVRTATPMASSAQLST